MNCMNDTECICSICSVSGCDYKHFCNGCATKGYVKECSGYRSKSNLQSTLPGKQEERQKEMDTYCENEKCQYNEDGCCEQEGALKLDENGLCLSFRCENTNTND